MIIEERKIDVDGLSLLYQSRVTIPLACGQKNGRRPGWCTNEEVDGYNVNDGWGHMTSTWCKLSSR